MYAYPLSASFIITSCNEEWTNEHHLFGKNNMIKYHEIMVKSIFIIPKRYLVALKCNYVPTKWVN